jgi:ABC-type transporter Mla subunit MlaD
MLKPPAGASLGLLSVRTTLMRGNMGIADKLKGLTNKAEDKAAEHKDQIHEAVEKAEAAADQRTGGKYHDQIQKAAAKADTFVDGLKDPEKQPGSEASTGEENPPRAS